jgi:hypothetical protein
MASPRPVRCLATHASRYTKRESNQLRYVCRQLHQETAGLGLRLNDLTFVDIRTYGRISAYDQFSRFMRNCSSQQLRSIKRATIIDDSTSPYYPYDDPTANVMNRLCVVTPRTLLQQPPTS